MKDQSLCSVKRCRNKYEVICKGVKLCADCWGEYCDEGELDED